MRAISSVLKNIKSLFPYFLLISIYFFFVNLEARKETNNSLDSDKEDTFQGYKPTTDEQNLRIRIPVVPYKE